MKTKLELDSWNRKEHFEYFRKFDEPFYNINLNVDCSRGFKKVKEEKGSLFIWYLYHAIRASNRVEQFRYRIEGDQVFRHDIIHASPTISRDDGTFGFAQLNFHDDYLKFQAEARKEIERVKNSTGLFTAPEREDVIHYSALPWISFTGLTHPRNFHDADSIPKISFGRIFPRGDKFFLPLSLHVNHALIDGYHVSLFVEEFSSSLNT